MCRWRYAPSGVALAESLEFTIPLLAVAVLLEANHACDAAGAVTYALARAVGPACADTPIISGLTAVPFAALMGTASMISAVVDCGVSVSLCDDVSRGSVVHVAAEGGSVDVLTLLLEVLSLDPHARNTRGETPLYVAAKFNNPDAIRYLFQRWNADPANAQDGGDAAALRAPSS